jgi:hypothetical protein
MGIGTNSYSELLFQGTVICIIVLRGLSTIVSFASSPKLLMEIIKNIWTAITPSATQLSFHFLNCTSKSCPKHSVLQGISAFFGLHEL